MEKLRLLLLEDVITDAELVLRTLDKSGINYEATLTHDEQAFVTALDEQEFDAILADNSLPQFSASEALKIINEKKITIPFILVTGSVSEEFAVNMMRRGAWDYILKDRLQRLPNSILSAVDKYRLEKERQKYLEEVIANEALLKEAARLAHFGSWELDVVNDNMRWSDETYHILGYDPGDIDPSIQNFFYSVHPDDFLFVKQTMDETIKNLNHNKFYCRIINTDGITKHIYSEMAVKRGQQGDRLSVNGFIIDVSESKEAELKEKKVSEDLLQRNKDLEQFTYIISHNLRAPVANIVGISNALTAGDLELHEQKEFMGALSNSIKKLDDIIFDLNYILEIKHNKDNESLEYISLSKIVADIEFNIGSIGDDKKVIIETDFTDIDELHTLKSYVHSIFYNLISNSIKFRQPQAAPVIKIKSHKYPGKIVLIFKDNSIGIDLHKKNDQVFGLYKRFHPDKAEGKGMGLFMVKTQVETIGGKISVQSKVNEGTEFTIEIKTSDRNL